MAELSELLGVLAARRSELFSNDNEWEQFMVYIEAFRLFLEREAKYQSLWMKYGAADSYQHMKSKTARSQFLLEGFVTDQDDPLDLINYSAFFLRNLRAGRMTNTMSPGIPENWLLHLEEAELLDLQHAARMMTRHPTISDELRQRYEGLANSLWGEFVRRREDERKPASKPASPPVDPSNRG